MRGIVLGSMAALVCTWGFTPPQDAALRDRVNGLVGKLGAEKPADRDAAEKALAELGPRVLPLLPADAPKGADDDASKRLERVRTTLEESQEKAALEASRVTIQGQGLRLSDVLRQVQQQTGNPITDVREQYGAETTNPSLDLDLKDVPFFEAMEEIARKGGVSLTFFTGDGSIGLMPAGGMYGEAPPVPGEAGASEAKPLVKTVGPFRVLFRQITTSRDLSTGQARSNAQFEVAWEPRLRPMLLSLKADQIEIVDDLGEKVEPEVMEESSMTVLRPENPSAEVNLNMRAPDRQAQSLKTLKVRGEVTLPGGIKRFRFPRLDAKGVSLTQGDVKMTLESTEVDENSWRVRVRLEMPGEGPAFESYRQGLFNNRLWLQKADGSRFEHNGGFNTTNVGQGLLGFEYIFVDVPGEPADYQLVYETPSRVLTVPLEFTFENVPLP